MRFAANWRGSFPGLTFYFLPADIVSQILNFGLPAPIDIQIVGQNIEGNRQYADKLLNQIKYIPGTTDLRIQQPFNAPKLQVDIDRTKSQEAGYTARDVASNLLVSLSGSFQTSPTFWLNPKNGVSYNIATRLRSIETNTLQALGNTPITNSAGTPPQILNSLATITPGQEQGTVSHYNVQPVLDIYGSVQGRDLGGVSSGHRPDCGGNQKRSAARNARSDSRPGADDEGVLHRFARWPGLFDCAGLSADRHQLPILAGSVRDHCGFAGGAGGNRLVSVSYSHDAQRSGTDRIDYVHGRGDSEQHSGRELCQGADGSGDERDRGRVGGGLYALPAGADDGAWR